MLLRAVALLQASVALDAPVPFRSATDDGYQQHSTQRLGTTTRLLLDCARARETLRANDDPAHGAGLWPSFLRLANPLRPTEVAVGAGRRTRRAVGEYVLVGTGSLAVVSATDGLAACGVQSAVECARECDEHSACVGFIFGWISLSDIRNGSNRSDPLATPSRRPPGGECVLHGADLAVGVAGTRPPPYSRDGCIENLARRLAQSDSATAPAASTRVWAAVPRGVTDADDATCFLRGRHSCDHALGMLAMRSGWRERTRSSNSQWVMVALRVQMCRPATAPPRRRRSGGACCPLGCARACSRERATAWVFTRARASVRALVSVPTCIRARVLALVKIHSRTLAYMRANKHTLHACTHSRTHTHTFTHSHTHIHTHTHSHTHTRARAHIPTPTHTPTHPHTHARARLREHAGTQARKQTTHTRARIIQT